MQTTNEIVKHIQRSARSRTPTRLEWVDSRRNWLAQRADLDLEGGFVIRMSALPYGREEMPNPSPSYNRETFVFLLLQSSKDGGLPS